MKSLRGSVVRRAAVLALVCVACLAPGAGADPGDPVDLGGEEVEIGTDSGNPTVLEAGLWSSTLAAGDTLTHHFAYERTQKDSTIHVSVTASGASSETLDLTARAADGTECGSESTSADFTSPWQVFGVDLAVGAGEFDSRDSACLTSTTIRFEVGPGSSVRDSDSDLSLAIKVVEESPLASVGQDLPEAPETEPAWTSPSGGDDRGEVAGGSSFDDAPLLDAGTHTSSVTEGEQRIYRVHLEWGQSLKAELNAAPLPADVLEATSSSGASLEIQVHNAMRRPLDSAYEGTNESGSVDDEALVIGSGAGPVRYRNRFSSWNSYLPGDYYVSVSAVSPGERAAIEVPFELAVEVEGEVTGEPEYADAEPFLVGGGERSVVASGNPPPVADDDGWVNARHLTGVGLAAVGVLCLALGAVRLRRR